MSQSNIFVQRTVIPLPTPPSLWRRTRNAVVAAFTSPTVVKEEKKTAVLIAVRIALNLGAAAGTVALVQALLKGVLGV